MRKRLLTRMAAAGAGGALALTAAAPAFAIDFPDYNAQLMEQHRGIFADHEELPDCEAVIKDLEGAGADPDDFIKDGFDVWVFNANPGQFDPDDEFIAEIEFSTGAINVPGHPHWIGPDANKHLLAVAIEAGAELIDGHFTLHEGPGGQAPGETVVVTKTCPGDEPENGNGEEENGNGKEENGEEENGKEDEEDPKEDEDPEELPVTGAQLGGLLVLAGGLLAAGVAMLFVRRRQNLANLLES